MSYIFNEFSTGKSEGPNFSSVVAVAREKGYTVSQPTCILYTDLELFPGTPSRRRSQWF